MSTESQLMLSPEVLLPVIDKLNLTQDKNYAAGYTGDGSTLRDWCGKISSRVWTYNSAPSAASSSK